MIGFRKISAVVLILLAGCTTPVSYTTGPTSRFDKDTEYSVVERPDGFNIAVDYSRYQFIPESGAVAVACKSALTSVAWDHARKIGKAIDPINDQEIRLSMGRNGLTGITSCNAAVNVYWKM